MIRINLLPHRAEKRRRRQIQFASLSVVTVVLGAVAVGMVYLVLDARIAYQERRNEFLKSEIAKLDRQIEEIRKLREQVKALMARKEVVENLQATRSDVVRLMDQMLRILPDGVYLKSLRQTGDQISLVGLAQSNARVSTLMHSIQVSPLFTPPTLIEIHATTVGRDRWNEFSLSFNLSHRPPAAATPAKPATPQGTPTGVQGAGPASQAASPTSQGAPAPAQGGLGTGPGKPPTAPSGPAPAPGGPTASPGKPAAGLGKPAPTPAPRGAGEKRS